MGPRGGQAFSAYATTVSTPEDDDSASSASAMLAAACSATTRCSAAPRIPTMAGMLIAPAGRRPSPGAYRSRGRISIP